MFVSNKRQNGWTDRTQILGKASHFPRAGLWMIKICLQQNSILLNLKNPRIFFQKIRQPFLVVFYKVYKEKMFSIKIEDWREAL